MLEGLVAEHAKVLQYQRALGVVWHNAQIQYDHHDWDLGPRRTGIFARRGGARIPRRTGRRTCPAREGES